MNDNDLLSVIIPAFNARRYLAPAIESIFAQGYHPLELIVVDDGSTDDTAEVALSFGSAIHYVFQSNGGIASALNRGLAVVRGEWLAFCAADDLWAESRLEKQFAAFAATPGPDLVFGHVQNFISPGLSANIAERIYCPPMPMPGISLGSMLLRRVIFERVGSFNIRYKLGEFVDWYSRAKELGLCSIMLADIVLWRRLHGDNLSLRSPSERGDFARILKASLDRRRVKNGKE